MHKIPSLKNERFLKTRNILSLLPLHQYTITALMALSFNNIIKLCIKIILLQKACASVKFLISYISELNNNTFQNKEKQKYFFFIFFYLDECNF